MKKAKKETRKTFIALMEQNRQSMIRIAFAYRGTEDVADAMQETILSAFEKLDTLRRAEYFQNLADSYSHDQPMCAMRRHRSRTVPMNEAEEALQFYDFSTDAEFNDLVKTLPEDSRLILRCIMGNSFP